MSHRHTDRKKSSIESRHEIEVDQTAELPTLPGRPMRLQPTVTLEKQVKTLGRMHCTLQEVADVLDVSLSTLRRAFDNWPRLREAYERGKGVGKIGLRRLQFKLAERNPTMAIWLGKQYLGQRDTKDVNTTVHLSDLPPEEMSDEELIAIIHQGLARSEDPEPEE